MRVLLASVVAATLGFVACGDDGKTGTRGAPAAAPTTARPDAVPAPPSPSPSSPAPSPTGPAGPPPPVAPGGTLVTPRVGDWVLYEVRAPGVDARTSLRWTAVAVEATRVRLRIEAGALDASGATVGGRTTEAWVPLPTFPAATSAAERVEVKGRALEARSTTRGEFTGWYAAEVPLGGLVRSRGPGGVEQTALDFGRGS